MTDPEATLQALGEAARNERAPDIDVAAHVMSSLRISTKPRLDVLPVAFAATTVAVAVAVCIACLPTWHIMLEPWAGYFPR
jgi:hypothetical protein